MERVFLSAQLFRSAGSRAPRSWRSPYLAYHPALITIRAAGGIAFDSSFGLGDLPFNVPLDLAMTGVQQRRFHRRPVVELPLTIDDTIDLVGEGGMRRVRRDEDLRQARRDRERAAAGDEGGVHGEGPLTSS